MPAGPGRRMVGEEGRKEEPESYRIRKAKLMSDRVSGWTRREYMMRQLMQSKTLSTDDSSEKPRLLANPAYELRVEFSPIVNRATNRVSWLCSIMQKGATDVQSS